MGKIKFKDWCEENRWTTTKLAKEFAKYGFKISPATIWYWQQNQYSPRNATAKKILSKICGFNSDKFFNKNKNGKI